MEPSVGECNKLCYSIAGVEGTELDKRASIYGRHGAGREPPATMVVIVYGAGREQRLHLQDRCFRACCPKSSP
jgi:hypothetical protein